MKALILAAGFATRLWPLTQKIPKALLLVNNRVAIDYIIEKVNEVKEVDEIILITNGFFYSQFLEWKSQAKTGTLITILNDGVLENNQRLGVTGDLFYAIKKTNIHEDLLVIAADNLFDFSLVDLVNYSKKTKTTVVACKDWPNKEELKKFGVLERDENGKIIGFEEKPAFPKTTLVSTACYVLSKKDLPYLDAFCLEKNCGDGNFFQYLSKQTAVHAFVFKEDWIDIGSLKDLEAARKRMELKK